MKSSQSGFTLIELVMVIVILGILAATAIPKFVNLQDQAAQAGVDGVAGAMSSAAAINYASELASSGLGQMLHDCSQFGNVMQSGIPGGYTVTALSAVTATAGQTFTCTVEETKTNKTATATGIYSP